MNDTRRLAGPAENRLLDSPADTSFDDLAGLQRAKKDADHFSAPSSTP